MRESDPLGLSPFSSRLCFFCGRDNPIGPQLTFDSIRGDEGLECSWTPTRFFGGLGNVVHGGILAGLLDEIMGQTAHQFSRSPGLTVEIQIQYQGPVFVEHPLVARARISKRDGRKIFLEAEVMNHHGEVSTRGRAVYVMMTEEAFGRVVGLDGAPEVKGKTPCSSG